MVRKLKNYGEKSSIACQLPDKQKRDRYLYLINDYFRGLRQFGELFDGFYFEFPSNDEWINKVIEFVKFERKCCPFIKFEIIFKPNDGSIRINLRGSKNTKEYLKAWVPKRLFNRQLDT